MSLSLSHSPIVPKGLAQGIECGELHYAGRVRQKARELKARQAEIAARINQHQQGDDEYRTTLESLISLAVALPRSKTEQKRQLLKGQARGRTILEQPFRAVISTMGER